MYNSSSIIKMSEIEHLRSHAGMYVGSTETATKLLNEVLDNSLDEVQAGHCDKIGVILDTKEGTFKIIDNGRGIPFNVKDKVEEDTPVKICMNLFTSGKFKKGENSSSYKIATGLHGIGLTAVYALSDWMKIEIHRDNTHVIYEFKHDQTVTRNHEKKKDDKRPFSTMIEVKPSPQYFSSTTINAKEIEERLRIACANYPTLKVAYVIDGKNNVISGTEDQLILDYLGENIDWFEIFLTNNAESCKVKFGWDDNAPTTPKILSTVNLIKVHEGVHINKMYTVFRNFFSNAANKKKFSFQPNDCLNFLRLYINLKIVKTSFEAQEKVRLESKTDLSIMDNVEKELEKIFKNNEDKLIELLEKFESYRKSLDQKKVLTKTNNKKRGSTKFTKLRDCKHVGGELFICEGDSAAGGLIQMRDPNKHAILPLRGVIPNSITKKDLLKNAEIQEIVNALGCGIHPHCDVSKIRYNKIMITCDADPSGYFISCLLVVLFSSIMPQVVKDGKVYLCKTPLFGTGAGKNFKPLWKPEEVDEARAQNKKIKRMKGLGEFDPDELKVFTFDEKTRNIIQLKWSKNVDKIFDLMSNSEEKRKLVLGEWSVE